MNEYNTSLSTYGKNHEQIIRELLNNLSFKAEQVANEEQSRYQYYQSYFAILSDAELVELKRKSRRNPGWVAARAVYEICLSKELQRRYLELPE